DRYATLSGTIGTSSEKTETSSYTTVKNELLSRSLPVINEAAGEKMRELILEKKKEGDSVGGIIECVVTGLPAGLGDPMFDGMENRISQAVFAIPAVKGIEFGAGFASAYMTGSENNDGFRIAGLMTGSENNDSFRIAGSMNESGNNKKIITETNNCGGILGGITNGMPLVFRAAFKPTPSIAKEQRSVNLPEMKDTALTVHGRHDPCIVPRALPCVEAAAALAIYDAYLGRKKELPGG
ncbi:MAG: chorismate synthase, partial [Lachnospiraceae bacterium]|nr:chorismate synthase [Lachnospiraceae bacterium]